MENIILLKRIKKPHGKEKTSKKGIVDDKKIRPQLIHNRFTNILDHQNRPSPPNDFFGSLVFDFSQDPVFIRIVDTAGNYMLEVSQESLKEFKMEVLLGEDKRSKPNFTILLGDCQCYPELPEGPLPLEEKPNGKRLQTTGKCNGEGIKLVNGDSTNDMNSLSSSEIKGATMKQKKELDVKLAMDLVKNCEENGKTTTNVDKMNNEKVFYCSEKVNDSNDGICGGGDATLSLSEAESLPKETASISGIRVKDKESSSIRKERRDLKEESKTQKTRQRATKSEYASALYKSNLEKFIGYLMKDDELRPVSNAITTLDKALVDSNSAIGGRRLVKCLGGNNYVVNFQEKNEKRSKITNADSISTTGDKSKEQYGKCLRDVKYLDEQFQSDQSDFKDCRHLDCKGVEVSKCHSNEGISFDGAKSEVSTSSSYSILSSKSNEPKTVKKVEEEFDSATSDCGDERIKTDSLEEFFLSLRENDTIDEECSAKDRERIFQEMKSEPANDERAQCSLTASYDANTTVETMWLSFIRLLFPNVQNQTGLMKHLISNSVPKSNIGNYPKEQVVQYKMPSRNILPGQFHESQAVGNMARNVCDYQVANSAVKYNGSKASVQLSEKLPITGRSSNKSARMFFNSNVAKGSWWL